MLTHRFLSRALAAGALISAGALAACGRSDLELGLTYGEDDGGGDQTDAAQDAASRDSAPRDARPGADVGVPPIDARPPCGPATCSDGCCDSLGLCEPGLTPSACGIGGSSCLMCGPWSCQKGVCVPRSCGPDTCAGCCQNGTCVAGSADAACGTAGNVCSDCTRIPDGICNAATGVCEIKPPPPPACNPGNCLGCCDPAGNCLPGFVDTQCGENGAACSDCTSSGSTCDVNVSPRSCADAQNLCPASYGGCASDAMLSGPARAQGVCTTQELDNAAQACSAGAHTVACSSFFKFEAAHDPSCGGCLSSFDYDFTELSGIINCAAGVTSGTCNHQVACLADCERSGCQLCPDPQSTLQCEGAQSRGTCAPFLRSIGMCLSAAVCLPTSNDFGGWLQQVGQIFCGQ